MADTFDLQDHIQALQDIENYEIPGEEDLRDDGAAGLLEGKVSHAPFIVVILHPIQPPSSPSRKTLKI
jgi:hypothetical protein